MIDTSRDRLLRYNGVDIDPVNWGWLCDKGRFGFEAINHEDRLGRAAAARIRRAVRWPRSVGLMRSARLRTPSPKASSAAGRPDSPCSVAHG